MESEKIVNVIGAGLAGVEAAYQLAKNNIKVKLYEMRPVKMTPAHHTSSFAELVCSNSLRGDNFNNAVGVLKNEMEKLDSVIIRFARKNSVPAGGALAVDREKFSADVTEFITNHPNIEVIHEEVTEIPQAPTIIASGPLTSDALSTKIKELLGEEGAGDTNRRTGKEDAGRQKVCPIPLPGLELPERNESCEIARKYLIEQRKLSEQLVDQMIAKGDIYESKNYHNVVFVGRDKEQNPRYTAMRGIDENRYRGEARGSEKAYGFGHIGTDEKLFVFESPIDLLSYITAVPEEWEKHSYISLGGLSEKAMKRMYTEYPHIHFIYLCLDNDEPGNERCRQFVSLIPKELSVYRLEPVKKDWNECLVAEVPVS